MMIVNGLIYIFKRIGFDQLIKGQTALFVISYQFRNEFFGMAIPFNNALYR